MINIRKSFAYFRNRYGARKSTNGWYTFDCPFCLGNSAKKIAVNFSYEHVKCWKGCFAGSITDFIQEVEGIGYQDARQLINNYHDEVDIDVELLSEFKEMEKSEVILPVGYTPLLDGTGILGVRARNYLQERGFNIDQLDSEGFGYCNVHADDPKEDYFGYIIIPFKSAGVLKYFIGRDYIGNFLRYKNPSTERFGIGKGDLFFNEDALHKYTRIFMTEGWADAKTMGKNGIASLGWNLSAQQQAKIFRSVCKELVIVSDKGFYKPAIQTAMTFLDIIPSVKVINFDAPGLDSHKDANEAGRDKVLKEYNNTPALTYEIALNVLNE